MAAGLALRSEPWAGVLRHDGARSAPTTTAQTNATRSAARGPAFDDIAGDFHVSATKAGGQGQLVTALHDSGFASTWSFMGADQRARA
jgi:hypothetical protein